MRRRLRRPDPLRGRHGPGARPTTTPTYWHPDGTPDGKRTTTRARRTASPRSPACSTRPGRRSRPPGLTMPWYAAMGNHDGLVQGNSRTAGVRGEGRRHRQADLAAGAAPSPPTPTVALDRAGVGRGALHARPACPDGHGFTEENKAKGTAYYYFDQGERPAPSSWTPSPNVRRQGRDGPRAVRLAQGACSPASKQARRPRQPPPAGSRSSDDRTLAGRDREAELLKLRQRDRLGQRPHAHQPDLGAQRRPASKKKKVVGGFWEINTASHIDWPQQARLLEIANNKDGTVSIFTTMIDHDGPLTGSTATSTTRSQLAALGRRARRQRLAGARARTAAAPVGPQHRADRCRRPPSCADAEAAERPGPSGLGRGQLAAGAVDLAAAGVADRGRDALRPRAGGRTRARRPGRTRSTSTPASG